MTFQFLKKMKSKAVWPTSHRTRKFLSLESTIRNSDHEISDFFSKNKIRRLDFLVLAALAGCPKRENFNLALFRTGSKIQNNFQLEIGNFRWYKFANEKVTILVTLVCNVKHV